MAMPYVHCILGNVAWIAVFGVAGYRKVCDFHFVVN